MAGKRIVIFTQKLDSHTDIIIRLLQQSGHEPLRLNTDDIPLNTEFDFGLDSGRPLNGRILITSNGRALDVEDVRSIWWRKPQKYSYIPEMTEDEREFLRWELNHAVYGILESIDCYWMSHPAAIRHAAWKIEQLQRARSFGFDIPRTILTSNPQRVRAFYDECRGQVIYKVLYGAYIGFSRQEHLAENVIPASMLRVPTTMMTERELEMLDAAMGVPSLFQEYVDKRIELRVTVIGDEVFSAEIHSQAHETTKIDWRDYTVAIPYRKADLPLEIEERCLRLVHSYGLTYGAIDLIHTPDDRYVFLENNPTGQFLFIQERVPELKMGEALVACLIRGKSR